MTNTKQTNEQRTQKINELEIEIVEYHVPRAVRPIGKTILSAMPLLFSVGAHTAWSYLSPETHPEGAAALNHILAGALFVGYNGYRMMNGEFTGLADKYKEYRKAEDELSGLKEKQKYKEKTKNDNTKINNTKINNTKINNTKINNTKIN